MYRITAVVVSIGAVLWAFSTRANARDIPWHWDGGNARILVRYNVVAGGPSGTSRPFNVPWPESLSGKQTRTWDAESGQEVSAQIGVEGGCVTVDPQREIPSGSEARFWVYVGKAESVPELSVSHMGNVIVETETYTATIDAARGGIIGSLKVRDGDRLVETLGKGIRWWVGKTPVINVEDAGTVRVTLVESGPVYSRYQVRYSNVPAPECSLMTSYTFYRDFLDVDYEFAIPKPIQIHHLKMPVNLAATGSFSGQYRNSSAPATDLMSTGDRNRWMPDRLWHDVTYDGPAGFGLGVIAREVSGNLYFMDSVRKNENEWIYAEPFGWAKPQEVSENFAVTLSIVPHGTEDDAWKTTPAKLPGAAVVTVSTPQQRGGPPIDSDKDGLPDLLEFQQQTNPGASDTDLDGIPDGDDPDPLCGRVKRQKLILPEFRAAHTSRPQTIAKVDEVGGVPTMVLDGQPVGPMLLTRCAASYDQLAEFGDINYGTHFEMVGRVGWPGEQLMTLRRLDGRINRFLDEIPNAKIILRLYLCSPRNFAKDYPDEIIRFNDGSARHYTKWYSMTDRPLEERGYPSFASEIWRENTAEALYNFVTHVRQSEYSDSVVGYFICGGGTEEWYYWGDYDHNRYATDFSTPMLREFRRFLREKYNGDVRQLRKAWGDETADFATALPPGPDERRRAGWGVFWDPDTQARLHDYYYVHNKVMEDAVLIFSRAVKQACKRQQLVGMFHGYLQNHWFLEGGQATLKDVLNSPDIDFWSGPPQYNRRGHGEHACNRFPGASLKVHDKLWISESDIRTTFSETKGSNPALHGRPPDLAASLGCLTREFSHQLCEGNNGWWFPMGRNWYNHPPILERFATLQRVGQAAMAVDRRPDTDIAAVIDLESLMTGPPWPISSSLLDAFKVQELCRIGAPVDFYELDDILKRGAKRYKMIIMLNAFSLTDHERKLIDRRLRRKGTTLVWMFAPGILNPDRIPELDMAYSQELLGFGLGQEQRGDLKFTMQLTESGVSDFPGISADRQFGNFERPEWKAAPNDPPKIVETFPTPPTYKQRFYAVEDGKSSVLARFVEGAQIAIASRTTRGVKDIWIGSVMAPADLLRDIARDAGCHLFCDADEIIYADKSFLAIHAATTGDRKFSLRKPADVIDVVTENIVAENVTTFSAAVDAFQTRTFYVGSTRHWQRALNDADQIHAQFQKKLRAGREERKERSAGTGITAAIFADPDGKYSLTKEGMVMSFLFCGPFPSPGGGENAQGFATDFLNSEDACQPVSGNMEHAVFQTSAGTPEATVWFGGKAGKKLLDPQWRPITVSMDTPLLNEQIPGLFATDNIAYYVACYVELAEERTVRVGIGSDDGFKLWVNGDLIGGANVSRGVGIDTNRYPVEMKAGRNLILLKIIQGGGPSGWSLRLTDPTGEPLTGTPIRLSPSKP